jgi:predicted RNA-binding Zn-ribbon protein involved in translation (DUF1610 family)
MRDPRYIPQRDQVRCTTCREVIDARAAGVSQMVMGWAPRRDQGGTNTIAVVRRVNEWLCPHCLDQLRAGHQGQGALFD